MTAAEMDRPDCLAAALRYAEHGWRILPLVPGLKRPIVADWTNAASADRAVIEAWWRRSPDAGVGILTGSPGPDVLDVDNKPGGTGWEALNRLKRAGLLTGAFALIRTRSGGLHLYFAGTSQRNAGAIGGHDLDYRATGGQVAAPPTWVAADEKGPAGVYELIESRPYTGATFDLAAARQLLEPPEARRAARPGAAADQATGWFRMDRMAAYVASLPEGVRNAQLFWACCRAVEAGMTDLGQLVDAAVSAGLPEAEAWRTAMSADRRAQS